MSSQDNKQSSSGSSGSTNPAWNPYEVTGRGTNESGNRYATRAEPEGTGYHYSNADGSYYYKHGDGSSYHNNGQGGSTYTAPDGKVYKK